jgi:AbiV family abortive infection protein
MSKKKKPKAVELSELFKERPLTHREIAAGMSQCFLNARDLIEDAELLRRKNRNARAFSLAALALEELGKIPMLYDMAFYSPHDEARWKKFWKAFRRHQVKQHVIGEYGKMLMVPLGQSKRRPYKVEIPEGFGEIADSFKQLGFYVNFFHDRFSSPEAFFRDNSDWIDFTIAAAKERLDSFTRMHSTPARSFRFLQKGLNTVKDLKAAVDRAGAKTPAEILTAVHAELEKHCLEHGEHRDPHKTETTD